VDIMTLLQTNEALWLLMLVANFAAILLAFRLFGRAGLYVWIALAGVVANIQVSKTVEILGMTATLGNIVYATSFLATDILSERYGKDAAKRGVGVGFFAVLSVTLLMQLAILFSPAPSDTMHAALREVFGVLPRIAGASLLAYVISQRHDVWAYHFWWERFPGPLWLRNNLSTIVSQLIDSVVFTVGAFLGVFPPGVLFQIVVTTYLFKAVVALLDTPFLYLAVRKLQPRDEPGQGGTDGERAETSGGHTETEGDHSETGGDHAERSGDHAGTGGGHTEAPGAPDR
jgi:queuosine precursor transporter